MVWGRKWLIGRLREGSYGDDGKVVEREHDAQRRKRELYERVEIPIVVYGSETWSGEKKIKVFQMMCLRNICAIRRVDRVRNSQRCECELSVLERIERNVLKWLGHVERMGEENLFKRMYRANVTGGEGDK